MSTQSKYRAWRDCTAVYQHVEVRDGKAVTIEVPWAACLGDVIDNELSFQRRDGKPVMLPLIRIEGRR